MMSRRNVISICIVAVVIIILIIMLVSTGHENERLNDINSGSGGTYNTTEQNGLKDDAKSKDIPYKETGQENINNIDDGQAQEQKYIVRDIGEGIVIYRCISGNNDNGGETQVFYDYALINTDSLPQNMKEMLNNGIEFYGERELYEFLQAYSS